MTRETRPTEPGEQESEKLPTIPEEMAVLPLRDTVVYPDQVIPLVIGRERSIKLVHEASEANQLIALVAQQDPSINEPSPENMHKAGTVAAILKLFKMPDGSQRAFVQGLARVVIKQYTQIDPYFRAAVEPMVEIPSSGVTIDALVVTLQNSFHKLSELSPTLNKEAGFLVANIDDPGRLSDTIAANLNLSLTERQELLEMADTKTRLEKVTYYISRELQVLELGNKIQSQVRDEIGKVQREYYLREQLKAIQKELGEADDKTVETQELRKKIADAKMSEEAQKIALKELDRLSRMAPGGAEYTVVRTYLDWLIDLPWSVATQDQLDLKLATQILEEDHYDLDKVKRRILEYLAVRKLKSDMKGPILCFAGPPGVGKTSLGRSIARALGRKFARVSLGGIRDEAEIRGHRRTYIGALPGRIIQGMRKAGSHNPLFMLDEIDKIGLDFRGDPSSALLEVLDPEQNHSFSDHYLEVSWDLSKVMFICTANMLDTIPPALRDRLEVLNISGYTEEEKIFIARRHLLPKQIEAHGLKPEHIPFPNEGLQEIIGSYTREAGVRNLEREIAATCRAVARGVAEGHTDSVTITPEKVAEFLGPARFFSEAAERVAESGVATGLAWTPTGGEIIFVEATKMKGSGKLNLTGSLGEVMKESAHIALSYVRARAHELCIDEDFDRTDIHLHVPSGAVPKDGPSAGIAIATALVSMLTQKRVKPELAMTGEVTLRGLVLPIGGVKEKVLAARRAGIKEVILPQRNRNDLIEIVQEIKEALTFHFVERLDEVWSLAFETPLVAEAPQAVEPAPRMIAS
ncbi:MAG: endopeptidase La [Acidobacteria bacterium]|nr:endopeptidase La [Acidobacteriota bacterium]MBI3657103.1 endopeptidase La [Acidobacteriota bacterium]